VDGEEWEKSIKTQLETAQIILLFLSADFFASDYIEKKRTERCPEAARTRRIHCGAGHCAALYLARTSGN
jgi:hypothetical protein